MSERQDCYGESSKLCNAQDSRPVVRVMPVIDERRPCPSLPGYMSGSAAGIDLMACLEDKVELAPGEYRMIPTGLKMAIPEGYEGQVRPRSGLAAKFGITVLNSPGTIDADYRGEIGVILINHGFEPYTIANGDRIAQLVIAPVVKVELLETAELDETERGEGGFGSTGVSDGDGKRCTDG